MNKITDYKEVSPLIFKYFKRGVITNTFLDSEDYKCEILEGRLFYKEHQNMLNLYVKRDGFFRLYFYALSPDAQFEKNDATIIAEVVGDGANLLEKNGFSKILERVKLEINSASQPTVSGEKSTKQDGNEIYSLLKNSFDSFTGYTPNYTQVLKECENGLYYKYIQNGVIAGVLRWDKSGKTAQIKHLCVSDKFRGKGIGKRLVIDFLKENPKAIVWTGKENIAALNLYKSLGFCESDMKSTVYKKDI